MIRGEVSEERREKAEKLQLELNKLNVSTEQMKGRLAIKAATMNLSGQSVMGLTPAYKLNYIRSEAALSLLSTS